MTKLALIVQRSRHLAATIDVAVSNCGPLKCGPSTSSDTVSNSDKEPLSGRNTADAQCSASTRLPPHRRPAS